MLTVLAVLSRLLLLLSFSFFPTFKLCQLPCVFLLLLSELIVHDLFLSFVMLLRLLLDFVAGGVHLAKVVLANHCEDSIDQRDNAFTRQVWKFTLCLVISAFSCSLVMQSRR